MERLIWRIENDEHSGPYGRLYFGPSHADEESHPSPNRDKRVEPLVDAWGNEVIYLTIRNDEYCGTASLRELAEWFEGFGKKLSDSGFKVVALAVPDSDVRLGHKQLVFRRDYARIIHTMSPQDFITSRDRVED